MNTALQHGNRRNLVLIGLIIGMFFSALEQTVVGTAIPTIVGDLNGFAIFAWVTTANMITATIVIPISGKLSDLFGRRLMYLIGMLFFVAGSLLCATSTTMEQLIIYRGIQGIGGGMIMPLSQTIIGDIFTAEKRAKWQGVFGGLFALSSVIGPFLGGAIVDNISWHWIFLINAPFGIVSAILIMSGLRHEAFEKMGKVHIDYLGIATLVPGLVLLLLGVTFGGDKFAWASTDSYLIFGGALALLAAFVFTELKAKEPILDIALFKNRVFLVTSVLGFLIGLGMFGAIIFVPMFMQAILGVSATRAGSSMTPMMIALILASVIGGRLLLKFKYRTVMAGGMILTAVSFYLMSTMNLDSTEWMVYIYMVAMGLGLGLVIPTLMIAVQDQFPKEKLGTVTAAATFFRAIGGTIGITVLSVIMNRAIKNDMAETLAGAAVKNNAELKTTLDVVGSDSDNLFQVMINPLALKDASKELAAQVVTTVKTVWTDSFSMMFIAGLIFIGLGVLTSLTVGSGRIKRDNEKKPEVTGTTVSTRKANIES